MCLYGNYEWDKATKLQLMREINLQGTVSRLQLAAEKWHSNKGDGNCMKRCVKFCESAEKVGWRR